LASAVLGRKIVLTASATEMSDFFNNPFIAFVGGFGKGPGHGDSEPDPRSGSEELRVPVVAGRGSAG